MTHRADYSIDIGRTSVIDRLCCRNMNEWYKEDLAYIHDVGFGDYALKSAPAYWRSWIETSCDKDWWWTWVAEAAC